MAERLIWNFEFLQHKQTPLIPPVTDELNDLKWENRYFWSADEIIHLNTIDPALLDITHYQQKHKEDHYYLLPNKNFNIKRRRGELLYKPIIKRSGPMLGFGPKINLDGIETLPNNNDSTIDALKKIVSAVKAQGVMIFVKKDAFIFKFPTTPTIKLELARLEVNNKVYFSVCVEGRSMQLVKTISALLLTKQKSCGYVSFLKSIIT
ncbi:hypothetical protein [Legionella waltersii]|uniref:Uncharacterized protein n=1 Tax=Legionella waltersii TaxID=66969 RepID=A0A0W1ADJ5_9GAMM|nr:hypothetical protein [Legionella waltersii]KTD79403.1 hypothetical protein Lwal_1475 [Legionella waltersii]SNU97857.1 Uncharacterised protein [Legionella waltersii]